MLVFAFQSEIWIAENFNFSVFEDFCLSLSWKYRFSQNVNHAKVQSKTNKYCKFHFDLTRRRLSKSRFTKLGMVPKKLYRNILKCHWDQNFGIPCFYIFEDSLWFLVITPNFKSLRRMEVAFLGRFLSRFCGRHYWPLFRELACELAEVTSEAHLNPGAFTWLLTAGNLTVLEERFLANFLLHDFEIFLAAAVLTGIT